MKIYIFMLFVALLTPQLIDALPKRNRNVPDCSQYDDGETLPDSSRCSQYYLCINGKALRKHCDSGLYYDTMSGQCNRAFLVDCNLNRLGTELDGIIDNIPSIELDIGMDLEAKSRQEPCDSITTPPPPCKKDMSTTTTTSSTTTTTTNCPTTTICSTTKSSTTTCTTTTCTTTESTTSKCAIIKTTTCSTTPVPCFSSTTKAPCTTTKSCTTTTICPTIASNDNGIDLEKPLQYLSSSRDCASLADGTILLDFNHCRRYYVCSNRRAKRNRCFVGTWFDREKRTCRPRIGVTNCIAKRN